MNLPPVDGCIVCGKQGTLFRCGKCRSDRVMYCGRDCQKGHWGVHKVYCSREDAI